MWPNSLSRKLSLLPRIDHTKREGIDLLVCQPWVVSSQPICTCTEARCMSGAVVATLRLPPSAMVSASGWSLGLDQSASMSQKAATTNFAIAKWVQMLLSAMELISTSLDGLTRITEASGVWVPSESTGVVSFTGFSLSTSDCYSYIFKAFI